MPAIINAKKSVDKTGAVIGDIITYKIEITNSGDVSANSVIFSDDIPQGMSFEADTFMINSTSYSGVNPEAQKGIAIGNIEPNGTRIISFKARIIEMPSPNVFENSAEIKYKYTDDPSMPNGMPGIVSTNIVRTTVSRVGVNIDHSVDVEGVTIGEIITYSTTMANTGNIALNNVILINTLPDSTIFIADSVNVDGNNMPGLNPQLPSGISIGSIMPGSIITISYKVSAETIPKRNPILNNVCVSYKYTLDPGNPTASTRSMISNSVSTQIVKAVLVGSNHVDLIGATLNDTLNYTVTLRNIGNIQADNVLIIDTVPQNLAFIVDSLNQNGIIQRGETTDSPGFNVGSILPGETITLNFKVLVDNIPFDNIIRNSASVTYSYTSNTNNVNGNSRGLNTNEVVTTISQALLNGVKTVDKINATVNEEITYTLELQNTGNTTARNVLILDTIPEYTTFVKNSLTINGILQLGVNPQVNNKINVGEILSNEIARVTYKIIAITLPTRDVIRNSASISYDYITNPDDLTGRVDAKLINEVSTTIKKAILVSRGFADRIAVEVGGLINYGVEITNVGNIKASNIKFTNTIPNGTLFSPESVIINEVNDIEEDPRPPVGIRLGELDSGDTITLTFDVIVTTLPSPNIISNASTITYNYSVDPLINNQYNGSNNSNNINVNINEAILVMNKSIDKLAIRPNDDLNIYISIKNVGNVQADNIILIDTIPSGMILINDSVNVNNTPQLGDTPQPPIGVVIPRIKSGDTTTVTYRIRSIEQLSDSISDDTINKNIAFVTYEYIADLSRPDISIGTAISNDITISIREAKLQTSSFVDKSNAAVGDVLNYSVKIKNIGNVVASNIVFMENLPERVVLIGNSVTINGSIVRATTISSPRGVFIGSIQPNETVYLGFRVMVIPNSKEEFIEIGGSITYEYNIGLFTSSNFTNRVDLNKVSTRVREVIINNIDDGGFIKYTDKAFVALNEIITYNIELENKGNADANNVVFVDTIPSSLTFIEDSFIMDGNIQYGKSPKSPNGVNIGIIGPREIARLSYKVRVNTIPNPKVIRTSSTVKYEYIVDEDSFDVREGGGNSNFVTNNINHAFISNDDGGLIQYVDKSIAGIGSILTYTIILKNTGNSIAENVVFIDSVPTETTFIQRSVVLDKIARLTMDPYAGILVGTIRPGESHTISFKVKVNNLGTLRPIVNTGKVEYDYILDPNNNIINHSYSQTNSTRVSVGTAKISHDDGGFIKTVDKLQGTIGTVVTYMVLLTNTGNIAAKSTILYDTIPNNTDFVEGSTTINGIAITGQSPNTGLQIGDISPQNSVTITYKVIIKSIDSTQVSIIPNNSEIYYQTDI